MPESIRSSTGTDPHVYVTVLAGGIGSRFWPASTPDRPKQLLPLASDEPHIRRILQTVLETAGFEVDLRRDGTDALEAVRGTEHYDLILLDIMMPGATGLEVLGKIREMDERKSTPVVILTAKGQDADRQAAFSLGADDFLTKPFSPKKLLARIHEIIDGD